MTITAPQAVEQGTWALDPVHSRVGFAVGYLAGTFHGSFGSFDATLQADGSGTFTLAGTADVASVQVADESLAAHLVSPEFFDAERAPQISFASKDIVPSGEDVAVQGDLAMKGSSRPVALTGSLGGPVADPYGRQRLNLRLETTVDRSEFGLDWNVPLPNGEPALAQDVVLSAELAFVKA
ncbi:MAG TPA: YceI family protein [Gaiellaceae bacterium]|nr:YceI family protein [Gaiellaceae bacterium]